MFDYCRTEPFPEISPYDLVLNLSTHLENEQNRPKKTSECPTEIYDIMQRCWKLNPEDRPPIKTIVSELEVILPNYYP